MPICKNCHSRISKFDKDICPICGAANPLDGVTSDTIEVTHGIDGTNPAFKMEAPRKKGKVFLYFATLGFLGIGFAYLRYKLFSVIWVLINLLIIGGVGAIFLLTPLKAFGFLVSFAIAIVINIIIGLVYRFKPNMKDGSGELIL